ncbi:TIGR02678 family protein [Nocardiopsis sp. HNM0947]|uniref:TIGR02678 family protein n=1 Tax=Nocardiopsis coralli TaxID=2772213 RepID=A0ABR9P989_9ACTN|nr:TIGR02678 family protein [Nocardiopsis coralli]MBE3000398.1 TIGR02678 family protein [Nocardiopsis coralli]
MTSMDPYIEDSALIGERQAAARALMARPLLTDRSDPADLALVRAHAEWLIQRFQRVLGYRLTVADDHARLHKRGAGARLPEPFRRAGGARFTPRTHTHLALLLAVLVEPHGDTTVQDLAGSVREAAREAGVDADPARGAGERRAFGAALRHLVGLGAVSEVSGAVADHVADPSAEVVLRPHTMAVRSVAAHLPRPGEDPATFLAEADESDPDGDQAGETALRRMLAEDAAVFREDLTDRQRDRLAAHQWRAAAALRNLLGCETEIRAEGVALVMPDEASGAPGFPAQDPVARVALDLVVHLSGRCSPGRPATSVPVPERELQAALGSLTGAGTPQRTEWERTAGPEVPDPDRMPVLVTDLLRRWGLLRGGPGERRLTAAAARYGAETDTRVPLIQDNDEDGGEREGERDQW